MSRRYVMYLSYARSDTERVVAPNDTARILPDMTEWYDRCKKLMEERDLKQEDLLQVFGVNTRGAVGHYLTGRRTPTPLQILAVAKLFGVTIEWLLTGRDALTVSEPASALYSDAARNTATRALIEAILDSDRQGTLPPEVAEGLRQTITALKTVAAEHKPPTTKKKTAHD